MASTKLKGVADQLAQGRPACELPGEADAGVRRARRGQGEIGKVRAPREMAVVEALRASAVEGDGADQRMRVEQPVDRVRTFPADRGIGARVALAGLAHVPQRDPMRCDKGEFFSVARGGNSIEQREDNRPE